MSRILLVDDEPLNLLLLEELLFSEGYETISAESGETALAIAKDYQPDLILLDIMMPDMDGFEVCQQLRKDETLQTVPVIFITALDDDHSRLRGLEMMGDDYFTKPFKSSLLLRKIKNTLRLQEMRSQEMTEQTKRQVDAAAKINQYLSDKFRLFVPDQFLSRIAPQGIESIQLGNAREEEITILFCDIRKFTTITESQTASITFKWLNAFFSCMSQVITTHHGFIDKYLGDAIMAVFDRTDCHGEDALRASIAIIQKLQEFNCDRYQYNLEKPISIGIGIHTGRGMIGTIGSDRRMDSTVIGDVVNTAARLEQLTKEYSCQIIASEAAIARVSQPELFTFKFIDKISPRGKQQEINLYEVSASQKVATPTLPSLPIS